MSNFNFQLTRGDTSPIGGTVTLTTAGVDAPYPIQPTDKVRFSAKYHTSDPDTAAVFYLSSPGRITVVDGPNGIIQFSITPADWATAFPAPIRKTVLLTADVQLSNAAGDTVYTLATGQLFIQPDTTFVVP